MSTKNAALLLFIISLSLLIIIILLNYIAYAGVISLWFFIALLTVGLTLLWSEIKSNSKKNFVVINVIILIIVPIIFVQTIPAYTYEEGKLLVTNKIGEEDNIKFIEVDYKTIPTTDKKILFHINRNYYYQVYSKGDNIFFTVDPITGQVFKLNERFY